MYDRACAYLIVICVFICYLIKLDYSAHPVIYGALLIRKRKASWFLRLGVGLWVRGGVFPGTRVGGAFCPHVAAVTALPGTQEGHC
jgi:hypothetical protein